VFLDTNVEEQGYLGLGDQTAIASPVNSLAVATEIQAFFSTPDLRNMVQEKRAFL
jgi:hypothetical protein